MLPYGNWVHFGFWYANRYVYFSSIFFVAGLSTLVVGLQVRPRSRLVKITAMAVLVWTFAQNVVYRNQYLGVWRNGETLWMHEISIPEATAVNSAKIYLKYKQKKIVLTVSYTNSGNFNHNKVFVFTNVNK